MKKIMFTVILALLILSLSGCVIAIPPSPPVSPSSPPDMQSQQPSVTPINPNWSLDTQSKVATPLPTIADVVEKVFPSVVAINTEAVTLDFFSRPQTQKGAGSGWIIDKNGIIVTNNHVVEGAKKVTVEMFDGRAFEVGPEKVYTDSFTDLAIIKVDASNLPAAEYSPTAKLRVGDWVVALGNPLGNGIRAKEGTISGLKVSLPVEQEQTLNDLIETSAAINPGNSGGPLVNLAGQVIGITSAKMAAVGVEGMGYAISMKEALPIIEQLIKVGRIIRPYLGVGTSQIDQYVASFYRLSVSKGLLIGFVEPNSPADKAGLRKSDIITHFNGKEIITVEAFLEALHSSKIGEEVTLTIVRDKSSKTIAIRLVESPARTG